MAKTFGNLKSNKLDMLDKLTKDIIINEQRAKAAKDKRDKQFAFRNCQKHSRNRNKIQD